jgi:hypothetical protein
MIPNLNSLIDRLSSAFRIEQEIQEEKNTVTLITHSYLGTRLLYTHRMSLDPLIEIAVRRAAETAAKESNINPSEP